MIRTTDDGAFVWFRLTSNPLVKIVLTLEHFIAIAKTHQDELKFRTALFTQGVITPMTELDTLECNYSRSNETMSLSIPAAAGFGSKDKQLIGRYKA